jgi:RNA polymerase sigma-70 factor (ECF subfamily)
MLQIHRIDGAMLSTTKEESANALPDTELVQRINTGDKRAFKLLMRRYNQALYRTARSILKDDAEAEDALQEAYLLAYRGIDKFRGDAKLSTWLTRIVVNEAIARRRKTHHRAEIICLDCDMEHDPDADMANFAANAADITPDSPEGAAMRQDARRLLEAKIDDLPEAFRTVFVLRAIEEIPVDEVALALNIPEATVRTRYFRARSLLRKALAREIDVAFEDAFSFAGERCDRIVTGVLRRLEFPEAGDA